jgi:acetoin utilization deacetylase AcuC-like enzyme
MSFPVAFHPIYRLPLPDNHRFPMEKYAALPKKLLLEGVIREEDFFAPEPVDLAHVFRVHDASYIASLIHGTIEPKEMRKIGFPWSPLLVERELRIAQV